MSEIKSPLRYPGGKSRVAEKIVSIIPSFDEYREPFLGGGSVFVHAKQKFPEKMFWINDIYTNLYCFWDAVQNDINTLISRIRSIKDNTEDGKRLFYELVDDIEKYDSLEKAAAFFVLNRITFSGTVESGGFSQNAFETRFTDSSIERVKNLSTLMEHVMITNLDYEKVVKAPSAGEKVFIYLDPPYYSATKSKLYGKNGKLHTKFDHERFANVLKDVSYKWLITYDNSEYIKDLFSFAEISEWGMTYGMRNVSKKSNQFTKEILIKNF